MVGTLVDQILPLLSSTITTIGKGPAHVDTYSSHAARLHDYMFITGAPAKPLHGASGARAPIGYDRRRPGFEPEAALCAGPPDDRLSVVTTIGAQIMKPSDHVRLWSYIGDNQYRCDSEAPARQPLALPTRTRRSRPLRKAAQQVVAVAAYHEVAARDRGDVRHETVRALAARHRRKRTGPVRDTARAHAALGACALREELTAIACGSGGTLAIGAVMGSVPIWLTPTLSAARRAAGHLGGR